jgi:hypothetical protein
VTLTPSSSLRSEAPPRYRSIPAGAVSTWGQEAVQFASGIGIRLDEGQEDILHAGMSLRADGLWLAQSVVDVEPRQNGKTAVFGIRALAGVYLLKEPLIVWTAHEFKTAKQSFLWVKDMVTNYDHLRRHVKSIRQSGATTEVELGNPRRTISFLARSGGSGRGFAKVSPLLMDEAYALSPEQLAAISYATSVAPNPQTWYASSAPLKDSEVLREMAIRGRSGKGRAIYFEWSAAGKVNDLEKLVTGVKLYPGEHQNAPGYPQLLELVAQANRAFPHRLTEQTILNELEIVPAPQIVRERLGVFSEEEAGGKIDPDRWQSIEDPESRREGDVSLAVDLSIERDWAAVSMYGKREDGLSHGQVLKFAPGADWVVPYLTEANETLAPVAIGMAAGTYAALKSELKKAGFLRPEERPIDSAMRQLEGKDLHPPQRGDLIVLNGTDMAAACGGLLEAVRTGTMRVVPADQLTKAVRVGQVKVTGDAMAWVRNDPLVDITTLVSLTEAKWSYEARVDEIEDYDPGEDLW